MFAVVEINDKQHLVREGDILTIDGNISDKKTIFSNILLIQSENNTVIGQPYVSKASVEATVIESGKREKDIVFKFKRKTGYKITKGHRQNSTLIKISKITHSEDKTKPKSETKSTPKATPKTEKTTKTKTETKAKTKTEKKSEK